jgi:hypothetical protein
MAPHIVRLTVAWITLASAVAWPFGSAASALVSRSVDVGVAELQKQHPIAEPVNLTTWPGLTTRKACEALLDESLAPLRQQLGVARAAEASGAAELERERARAEDAVAALALERARRGGTIRSSCRVTVTSRW